MQTVGRSSRQENLNDLSWVLVWPVHAGVQGSERADHLAGTVFIDNNHTTNCHLMRRRTTHGKQT